MKKRIPIAAGLAAVLLSGYFAITAVNQQLLTNTFNRIYAEGTWGRDVAGKGTSGTGSTLEITREYRAYLEDFIKTHHIKSVVDAGCGDWTFSSVIDWNGASYLGVDIASDVIATVRAKHEKATIKFQVGDITDDLPAADLLISKDVLQHLSNANVQKLLALTPRFKYSLITNAYAPANDDCENGDTRPLDIRAAPFNLTSAVLVYPFHEKATFLVVNA